MQFKKLLLLSFLGGVMADAIGDGFTAIGVALDALDAAVLSVTAANVATKAIELNTKSDAVAKTIAAATAQINASKELTIVEAANVLTPAKTLETKTQKTIDDLISKKDLIAKAGQTAVVKGQLTNQATAAKTLSDAVESKMPAATKPIAKNQAKAINDHIARGVAAF